MSTESPIGSKAAALASLRRAGLPVPNGFVVRPSPMNVNRLCEAISGGGDWRREALALRARLSTAAVPESVCAAAERLRPPLAVRSSALLEDAPHASFAGLFSTFLGVRLDELDNAVRGVWASRFSDIVVGYAIGRGVDVRKTTMAVIVQEVVDARAAGTALSADSAGRIVISAACGLGRSVMDGRVVPDTWRVDGQTFTVLEQRVGSKPVAAYVDPHGGELWRKLRPPMITAPCLNFEEVLRVARLALAAERALGAPQELEWAIDHTGRAWLLQSRPLMTVTPEGSPRPVAWLPHARMIDGSPASPGQVDGFARSMANIGPGEILVARSIPPGTLAVLCEVGGLVVEAGGTTAHAATLARERGIPAVFGATGATRLIPQGALVRVDGTTGRVWYQLQRE